MIIVTGGAGFIGSAVVWGLNQRGVKDIVIVDAPEPSKKKQQNLQSIQYRNYVGKHTFRDYVRQDQITPPPEAIIHLGACSSTLEDDMDYLRDNNYLYTRDLAQYSIKKNIRFIYASSAATYGDGSKGFSDDHQLIPDLEPLNKYARSKQLFDECALENGWLNRIVGLKYFNVYGPNEYHKGEMRSVVHKCVPQAQNNGTIRLFRSYRDDYEDGRQKRDFLYVKDAVDMTLFFLNHPDRAGIYNVGTGQAQTFDELAKGIFNALDKPVDIEYFDMPDDIRENYQYFTEADLSKIRAAGYQSQPRSVQEGIQDYVQNYLTAQSSYLTGP